MVLEVLWPQVPGPEGEQRSIHHPPTPRPSAVTLCCRGEWQLVCQLEERGAGVQATSWASVRP